MRLGWNCPKCGGAHPPDVQTCPNQSVPYMPMAPSPYDLGAVGCPACRNGGLCGCVRPGRQVTCRG